MEGSAAIEVLSPTHMPKMAWNLSPPQPICSLNEVMSEELAKSLQKEEEQFEQTVEW